MAKFSGKNSTTLRQRPNRIKSPVTTTGPGAPTFEGGQGFSRDAKSDLFLLAVTNMVGQDTFYETGANRDDRFASLVHQVTLEDPEWMQGFLPYLRKEMFMRSAAVVAAAEYVAAGGPNGRALIAATLTRPDEPAELLGYWHATYGRNEPKAIKRGVADAVRNLYNENAALKYDGQSRAVRMGDVLERVHPQATDAKQGELFKFLLDRRHHPQDVRADLKVLTRIARALELDAMSDAELRAEFAKNADALADAGYTWERLSGKMKMDAQAWEAIIPQMGYMALLRNLRNFEQAGISKASQQFVINVLSDPDRVAKSMQFPYRFYSAYKNTVGLNYAAAVEAGLDLSTQNIPALRGRSLILVDVSGSMQAGYGFQGERSTVAPWEKGALFGVAQFMRADNADLVAFATGSEAVSLTKGGSVLRGIEALGEVVKSNRLGHGTDTWQSVERHYNGHDRVVIFSDMQSTMYHGSVKSKIPAIYNFNLAGHAQSNMETGTNGRHEIGGFSDAAFRMINMIEQLKNPTWPWE